jgi:hypothetical protein
MDVCQLRDNEILATAQRVKYRRVEYNEGYVTIEQNRTRRRVPDGYHFEDNGVEIYVSTFYSHIFQHQAKIRRFIVNKVTKEWRDFIAVSIEHHIPERIEPKQNNIIIDLKKKHHGT